MRFSENYWGNFYFILTVPVRNKVLHESSDRSKVGAGGRKKCNGSILKTGFGSFINVFVGLLPIGEDYFSGVLIVIFYFHSISMHK